MIKVQHPLASCNQQQADLLQSCPEDQKRYHELMFNYGNAVYRYHGLANDNYEPTHEDFKEWLEGLPENIRNGMADKGFEACKSALPFTRYVNEKNDVGLEEFVQKLMGKELYQEYKKLLHD
ncbi:MAG: hypothetical protein AAGC65_07780 [Mucilaginibacter sp.]|uniref:hypothetical protein n=1 Tax=Mucilaginibacter sp. TaxID=1882438 RepID=UPI0031A8D564